MLGWWGANRFEPVVRRCLRASSAWALCREMQGDEMNDDREFFALLDDAMLGRMSRREVLKRAVALGLSVPAISALLAACGSSADETSTSASTAGSGSGSGSAATAGTSGTSGTSASG